MHILLHNEGKIEQYCKELTYFFLFLFFFKLIYWLTKSNALFHFGNKK